MCVACSQMVCANTFSMEHWPSVRVSSAFEVASCPRAASKAPRAACKPRVCMGRLGAQDQLYVREACSVAVTSLVQSNLLLAREEARQ